MSRTSEEITQWIARRCVTSGGSGGIEIPVRCTVPYLRRRREKRQLRLRCVYDNPIRKELQGVYRWYYGRRVWREHGAVVEGAAGGQEAARRGTSKRARATRTATHGGMKVKRGGDESREGEARRGVKAER